jgi:phage terminase large subunit-like protein
MLKMGLRLGPNPRLLWTTTPKPKDLIRKLVTPKAKRFIYYGSTYDNRANLPDSFFEQLKPYEGTQLGRQELMGEIIDAEEGAIIARKWLKLWPAKKPLPIFDWIVMSVDTAFTERTMDKKTQTADPTASGTFGIFWHEEKRAVMLLDCWDDHLGFPDLVKRVKKEMSVAYGDDQDSALIRPLIGSSKPHGAGRKPDLLIIEDKGSGISLRQALAREGIDSYAYNPGRADKTARLHMVSHIFARGQVWIPESENNAGRPKTWVEPLLAQLCSFSGSGSIKNDDYVDVCSQGIKVAIDLNLLVEVKRDKQKERDDDARESAPRVYVNPYSA